MSVTVPMSCSCHRSMRSVCSRFSEVSSIRFEFSRVRSSVFVARNASARRFFITLAHVLLAPALWPVINRRRVDVVDAEVECLFEDRYGGVLVVRLLERGLTAEAENADLVTGLSEISRWHGLTNGRSCRRRGSVRECRK